MNGLTWLTCLGRGQAGPHLAGVLGRWDTDARGREPVSGWDVRRVMYFRRWDEIWDKVRDKLCNAIMG